MPILALAEKGVVLMLMGLLAKKATLSTVPSFLALPSTTAVPPMTRVPVLYTPAPEAVAVLPEMVPPSMLNVLLAPLTTPAPLP